MLYDYKGKTYPDYLKHGNAMQFVEPFARKFCVGSGLDVGAGHWPLPGATPIEARDGGDANELPEGQWDYVFSSHCLEHLVDYVCALAHWKTRLRPGGVLFLYLPHPDMEYWRPENCRKHLHIFRPADVAAVLKTLGFERILTSERDMAWSFCVVAFNPEAKA